VVYDLLVVGGGIAGMTAANRTAELGKRVVVLEKGSDEKYPSNTRFTYGTFHINFNSPLTGEQKLLDIVEAATEGYARKDLARSLVKAAPRLMQWLAGEGVALIGLGQYHTHVLSPVQRTGAGLYWDGYAGDVTLQRLEANLKKRGGTLLRGTKALSLKPGDPVTVEAEQAQGKITFKAHSIVIADGGFQANPDMVREFISPAPDRLCQRHGRTATGDGIRMAQAVGAALSKEMGNFYGHLHAREAMTNPKLWPRPQADDLAAAGIIIDASGRRIADESYGGIYLSNAIARLPDPLGTSVIFDHAIWEGPPGRGHAQPPNPLLPENGGTLHQAGTLAELAPKIGLAPRQLEDIVASYNNAIETGTLDRLSPPRGTSRAKVWPIKVAPFYAIPLCTAITNTMGGIAIDGDCRVLDMAGMPIPGLYAAGSTVGGLDGGPHSGYVGGLIKTALGLHAAEVIAGFKA
jgi:fumarate reductase flavoprotein subunit